MNRTVHASCWREADGKQPCKTAVYETCCPRCNRMIFPGYQIIVLNEQPEPADVKVGDRVRVKMGVNAPFPGARGRVVVGGEELVVVALEDSSVGPLMQDRGIQLHYAPDELTPDPRKLPRIAKVVLRTQGKTVAQRGVLVPPDGAGRVTFADTDGRQFEVTVREVQG